MTMNEEAKCLYLKSIFKNIDEFKAEDIYKSRASFLGQVFKGVNDDDKIKRNRWFVLLRLVNGFCQYDSGNSLEEEEIFAELKAHPYYEHFNDQKLVSSLFNSRKKLHETLKEFDKDISDIFYGLYHIHPDAQAQAIREFEQLVLDKVKRLNLVVAVKIFDKKLPELSRKYSELFNFALIKGGKKGRDARKSSEKSSWRNSDSYPWYYYLIFIIIVHALLKFLKSL